MVSNGGAPGSPYGSIIHPTDFGSGGGGSQGGKGGGFLEIEIRGTLIVDGMYNSSVFHEALGLFKASNVKGRDFDWQDWQDAFWKIYSCNPGCGARNNKTTSKAQTSLSLKKSNQIFISGNLAASLVLKIVLEFRFHYC